MVQEIIKPPRMVAGRGVKPSSVLLYRFQPSHQPRRFFFWWLWKVFSEMLRRGWLVNVNLGIATTMLPLLGRAIECP